LDPLIPLSGKVWILGDLEHLQKKNWMLGPGAVFSPLKVKDLRCLLGRGRDRWARGGLTSFNLTRKGDGFDFLQTPRLQDALDKSMFRR